MALEQLGFDPCYHMVECFPRGPAHWHQWVDALAGKPDWDALFEGFAGTVDFPACTSFSGCRYRMGRSPQITIPQPPRKSFARSLPGGSATYLAFKAPFYRSS
ncbi:sulfotransferase [Haliea sp. E17]|uniref:sulfotransferase n=1 Tax=Haliea sp. E17 TaxID=3401576 RepID=UPI003AAC90C5